MTNNFKRIISQRWLQGPVIGLITLFVIVALPLFTPAPPSAQTLPDTFVPTFEGRLGVAPATLPPLPYAVDALEPYIDAETMELHHGEHHATYVENLNEALADYPDLQAQSLEDLLADLEAIPESVRMTLRNNGGGHLNHSMFWQIMSPDGGGEPAGAIAQQINETFGSFATFQEEFEAAGANQFGSGWVWLVYDPEAGLEITSTLNQNSPLMEGQYPIMGNDVWEHAYYLQYQNRRPEYLSAWWNVVNWPEVNRRYEAAIAQS